MGAFPPVILHSCLQVSQQLQKEKEALMDKKRREQEERQRKQLELEQILEDNRRRVRAACACTIQGQVAGRAPEYTFLPPLGEAGEGHR